MTGKEAMEEMGGMKSMVKDADRLAGYLKENPDVVKAIQEQAGLGRSPAAIISTLAYRYKTRLETLQKALEEAELPII